MIEVTNLTKKYGSHVAVENLSFRVEKGQIYGFLGPNGAGKSTTMNIITGYIAPSEGKVTIDGRDILKEPEEARKRIGYLPEIPPLYTEMTVQEYLVFAARLKKIPKGEQRAQIEKSMEMTGTKEVRGRLIRNLSKGYRQRVGLAQAILGDPEVIILDEPSVGLDPKQIIEIRDLIRRLGEEHTIILSSHILSEVSAICDHIMIISHGRLAASDSPEGLRKLMSGSMELNLTVKGREEALRAAVDTVPGVSSAEPLAAPGEGFARIRLIPDENTDIREAVFYALAEARLPIMEMTASEKSLEDIFLELTEGRETEEPEGRGRKLFGGRTKKKSGKVSAAGAEAMETAAAEETMETAAVEEALKTAAVEKAMETAAAEKGTETAARGGMDRTADFKKNSGGISHMAEGVGETAHSPDRPAGDPSPAEPDTKEEK